AATSRAAVTAARGGTRGMVVLRWVRGLAFYLHRPEGRASATPSRLTRRRAGPALPPPPALPPVAVSTPHTASLALPGWRRPPCVPGFLPVAGQPPPPPVDWCHPRADFA